MGSVGSPTPASYRARAGEPSTVAELQAEKLAEFLQDPPSWFLKQAATIPAELPARLVNPLANAVATELFGSPQRWREVLQAVEEKLKEMA